MSNHKIGRRKKTETPDATSFPLLARTNESDALPDSRQPASRQSVAGENAVSGREHAPGHDFSRISVLAPQVQRQAVEVASLGLAVFEAGRSISSSGSLYHNANTPSYMHERTPATATWETVTTELHIQAHHPRIGWGDQDFYYRLSYERNGHDIRNAQVDILRDKSSGMYTSTFGATWSGQTHSQPSASVCQIVFNISGEWNPHGRGHVSWWGRLLLSAAKGGAAVDTFSVGSEQNWVWAA